MGDEVDNADEEGNRLVLGSDVLLRTHGELALILIDDKCVSDVFGDRFRRCCILGFGLLCRVGQNACGENTDVLVVESADSGSYWLVKSRW